MKCAECARLEADRARLERAVVIALERLDANFSNTDLRQYLRLRTIVHEAKLELSLTELELKGHGKRHPEPGTRVSAAGS